jgi:hypothetical protein
MEREEATMMRAWCAALLLMIPATAVADGFKLSPQKEHEMEYLGPAGWEIEASDDDSKVVLTEPGKQGSVTIQSITKKDIAIDSWIKMMNPGAKPTVQKGWTCAEVVSEDKASKTATCGQVRENMLLFVTVGGEQKFFAKMGGMKLVQKIAASVKGFKPPGAGE